MLTRTQGRDLYRNRDAYSPGDITSCLETRDPFGVWFSLKAWLSEMFAYVMTNKNISEFGEFGLLKAKTFSRFVYSTMSDLSRANAIRDDNICISAGHIEGMWEYKRLSAILQAYTSLLAHKKVATPLAVSCKELHSFSFDPDVIGDSVRSGRYDMDEIHANGNLDIDEVLLCIWGEELSRSIVMVNREDALCKAMEARLFFMKTALYKIREYQSELDVGSLMFFRATMLAIQVTTMKLQKSALGVGYGFAKVIESFRKFAALAFDSMQTGSPLLKEIESIGVLLFMGWGYGERLFEHSVDKELVDSNCENIVAEIPGWSVEESMFFIDSIYKGICAIEDDTVLEGFHDVLRCIYWRGVADGYKLLNRYSSRMLDMVELREYESESVLPKVLLDIEINFDNDKHTIRCLDVYYHSCFATRDNVRLLEDYKSACCMAQKDMGPLLMAFPGLCNPWRTSEERVWMSSCSNACYHKVYGAPNGFCDGVYNMWMQDNRTEESMYDPLIEHLQLHLSVEWISEVRAAVDSLLSDRGMQDDSYDERVVRYDIIYLLGMLKICMDGKGSSTLSLLGIVGDARMDNSKTLYGALLYMLYVFNGIKGKGNVCVSHKFIMGWVSLILLPEMAKDNMPVEPYCFLRMHSYMSYLDGLLHHASDDVKGQFLRLVEMALGAKVSSIEAVVYSDEGCLDGKVVRVYGSRFM